MPRPFSQSCPQYRSRGPTPGFGPGRPVLTLFDALGRVVRVVPAAASSAPASVRVDLAGLAPGVYVVRIAGAEKVATSRLVVE
ncbi:MAG: T9SS type A sorting domain-containing protein [Hymenobacter sp.]